MLTIHCHLCGGFIDNPAGITYREPNAATPPVVPHSALCTCKHSIVYGSEQSDSLRGMHHIRSAVRN